MLMTTRSLQGLFLVFIFPLALLTVPDLARAHHEQLARQTFRRKCCKWPKRPSPKAAKVRATATGLRMV